MFNVIPWFVALPTSLFGGSISDHLIRQGEQNLHSLMTILQFSELTLNSHKLI